MSNVIGTVPDDLAPYIPKGTVLLGLTGSRLYGFATPESDYDWKGAYQAPTTQVLSLTPPKGTVHSVDPDVQVHELGKFINLLLQCNPTNLELLYLPEYLILTPAGQMLVDNRDRFLWSTPVRNAFRGKAIQMLKYVTGQSKKDPLGPRGGVRVSYVDYAADQFRRIVDRDGTYKSKLRKRTAKHTRHLFRLLEQGEQLLTTGQLDPRVEDPERIVAMGELELEAMVPIAEATIARFDKLASVLPREPDRAFASQALVSLRLRDLADETFDVPLNLPTLDDLRRRGCPPPSVAAILSKAAAEDHRNIVITVDDIDPDEATRRVIAALEGKGPGPDSDGALRS